MKKTFVWFGKCLAAAFCAFFLLNIFSFFYYNTGRHVENQTGSTSFVWNSNMFYCQMREGVSFGFTDSNGFVNLEGKSDADVLIVGSSFMEGMNVMPDENAAYRLNELFDESGLGLSVYNIGLSSHNLYVCAGNVENALKEYHPEYIVLESYMLPTEEGLANDVLSGNAPFVPSHSGFAYNVQSLPLPKFALQQLREFESMPRNPLSVDLVKNTNARVAGTAGSEIVLDQANSAMLEMLANEAAEHGATLIFLTHPYLILQEDGSAKTSYSKEYVDAISEILICSLYERQ